MPRPASALSDQRRALASAPRGDPRRGLTRRVRVLRQRLQRLEQDRSRRRRELGAGTTPALVHRRRGRNARRSRQAHLPPGRRRPRRRRGRRPRQTLRRARLGDLLRRRRRDSHGARRPAGKPDRPHRHRQRRPRLRQRRNGSGDRSRARRDRRHRRELRALRAGRRQLPERGEAGDRRGDPAALRSHIRLPRRPPARRNDRRTATRTNTHARNARI